MGPHGAPRLCTRRVLRKRYYIAFNTKPSTHRRVKHPKHGYMVDKWDHPVWPILFKSSEEAWAHLREVDVFQNSGCKCWSKKKQPDGSYQCPKHPKCLIPGTTRIVSCSVESKKVWVNEEVWFNG